MEHIITSELANQYAEKFSSPEDPILKALNLYTQDNVHGAHMISGHLQGNFLKMMSMMTQPMYVIELGTYTGYATIALAAGLKPTGKVHTIDTDAKIQPIRDDYWKQAGLENRIVQHIGKALDVLPTLKNTPFDLAFIDADKGNYINYLDILLDMMTKNGTIIIDNTLFHGKVLESEIVDKNAIKIHQFNEYLNNQKNLLHVMLPIRDGITIVKKIK